MPNEKCPISGNILVVDDNPSNIRVLMNVLVERGHKVRPATSGETALATIQKKKPNLVLLDIRMPGMDGYEVCRKLKAQAETKDIPVIFLSVASEVEDKVLAFQEGGVDFITKPIQTAEVIVRVETHLKLHAMEEVLRGNERQMRLIADDTPACISYVGMDDLRYRFVNRRHEETAGMPREEIIGKHIRDVIGESNYQYALQYIEEVKSSKPASYVNEFDLDEGKRWINVNYVPDMDEDGRGRAVVVSSYDITDVKRAEEELRLKTHELGERVKELNCLYSISKIAEKRDIPLEEALQGVVELIPPSWSYPEVTCARITLNGKEFKTENFVQSDVVVSQSSDIVVRGRIAGSVEVGYLEERAESDEGPFLDDERRLIDEIAERLGTIVERVRAEEAQKSANNRLNQIIEFLPDPTFVIDDQGRVTAWNLAMAELTGVRSESIIGKGDREYALPFYESRRPMVIDLVTHYDEQAASQYDFVRREGTALWPKCTSRIFVAVVLPGYGMSRPRCMTRTVALSGPLKRFVTSPSSSWRRTSSGRAKSSTGSWWKQPEKAYS